MAVNDVKELAICQVIKSGSSILLIRSEEGINKGKWNAPMGEIQQGETPVKAAMRSVFQQTGLYVTKAVPHGTIRLFLNGKNEYSYRLHVFSTKLFSGDLKPNVQGEARWFAAADVPYYEMWADDKYWVNLVLEGKEFDADFFFDETNEKIVKYQIKEKPKTTQKVIVPILVIALIIGVAAFGAMSLGKSNLFTTGTTTVKAQPVLAAPKTTATTIVPTTVTTTIVQVPLPPNIDINNIDFLYNYTGPSQINNTYCDVPTRELVFGYNRFISTSSFLMNTTFANGGCPETITNIQITTPGFHVVSVTPQLPIQLPADSQVYVQFKVTSPTGNFIGPISLVESYQ